MNTKLTNIKELLVQRKLRVTKARLSVSEVLINNADQFLSSEQIYTIINKSKDLDCDQVSVYRVLTKFEELEIVVRGNFFGEAARFQLNSQLFNSKVKRKHEHYFKCLSCNKIEPFKECVIASKEKELQKNGYKNLNHHLEITGLCPLCAT